MGLYEADDKILSLPLSLSLSIKKIAASLRKPSYEQVLLALLPLGSEKVVVPAVVNEDIQV
jgi:hypothetical protein